MKESPGEPADGSVNEILPVNSGRKRDLGSLTRGAAVGQCGFEFGDDWPPAFIGDAVSHGVPVIAYTVNDEPTMRRLIELGVSGIETDDPSLLLKVVSSLHLQ